MRAFILITIGVAVGLGAGAILFAGLDDEKDEVAEARVLLGSPAADDDAGQAKESPAKKTDFPGELKNRQREPESGRLRSEDENLRARLIQLHLHDRDGESLPETWGILVSEKPGLCLMQRADLLGAATATARHDGDRLDVRAVVSERQDLGLVLLQLATPLTGNPLSTRVLEHGDRLLALNPISAPLSCVFVRHGYDPDLRREVLELDPEVLPRNSVALIRANTEVAALCVDGRDGRRAIALGALDLASFIPLDIDLGEFHQRYYAGSVEERIRAARKAYDERRYPTAISIWQGLFAQQSQLKLEYGAELEAAWRARLREVESNRPLHHFLLGGALVDFPEVVDFWLARGRTARELELYEEALNAYLTASRLDPARVPDLMRIRGEIYLDWSRLLIRNGQIDAAHDLLFRAIEEIENNAELWLLFAQLCERRRSYDVAARSYRNAIALDPTLAADFDDDAARAERLMAGPGRFVLDYDPRQRAMKVTVRVNGRAEGEFIVDTGATVSMIPDGLAQAAGLDTSARVPRVRIHTAGSSRVLPYSPSSSLELGGLRVEGLSVVVGNLSGNSHEGLLGMDFLKNFHLENDTTNGRLVLSER